LEALAREVRDRFGPPPSAVEALFDAVAVRLAARRLSLEAVEESAGRVIIVLGPTSPLWRVPPSPRVSGGLLWRPVTEGRLVWDGSHLKPSERLRKLRASLQAMAESAKRKSA
jgi:transcription-repair coupling factor (superfamily II helicase)